MRIRFQFTHNSRLIDYNYQYDLARQIHKWLGVENQWHGRVNNPLSFGNLSHLKPSGKGLVPVSDPVNWWVGSWDGRLLKDLIRGVNANPSGPLGFRVQALQLVPEPSFGNTSLFWLETPLVLRLKRENQADRYVIYSDPEADELLRSNLLQKLAQHQVAVDPEAVRIHFHRHYAKAKTRLVRLRRQGKDISVRGSICPVVVEGPPEVHRFIWAAGLGASTGIGFGGVALGTR